MIGSVSKCAIQNEHFDISFNRVGNMKEIFIQHRCEILETAAPDTDRNCELPSDIFQLD